MSAIYQVNDLKFSYKLGNQTAPALRGVSLKINKGDFVGLAGPSGSGKTTLLSLLGLIEPTQDGDIQLMGKSLSKLTESEKNNLRKHKIGFIFQNFHLFPVLRADENVEYFLIRQGIAAKERKKRVKDALESVGLWEHRHKRPLQMSGGQRQRVAVARAIAKNPEVIIADEMTANLDQKTGREIMNILLELNKKKGVTIVVASHDPMVLSLVPKKIDLIDGRLN